MSEKRSFRVRVVLTRGEQTKEYALRPAPTTEKEARAWTLHVQPCGEVYRLAMTPDCLITCTCPAFNFSHGCKHADFMQAMGFSPTEEELEYVALLRDEIDREMQPMRQRLAEVQAALAQEQARTRQLADAMAEEIAQDEANARKKPRTTTKRKTVKK